MSFPGEQATSRATRVSGRTLLGLPMVGSSIAWGWLDATGFSMAGLTFKVGFVESSLALLVAFLMLAHIVQWFGDLKSFNGWNIAGRKVIGLQDLSDTEAKSKLEALGRDLDRVLESRSTAVKANSEQEQSLIRVRDSLPKVAELLPAFTKSVRGFGRFAFFYVYIWHLAVPLVGGSATVVWLKDA